MLAGFVGGGICLWGLVHESRNRILRGIVWEAWLGFKKMSDMLSRDLCSRGSRSPEGHFQGETQHARGATEVAAIMRSPREQQRMDLGLQGSFVKTRRSFVSGLAS